MTNEKALIEFKNLFRDVGFFFNAPDREYKKVCHQHKDAIISALESSEEIEKLKFRLKVVEGHKNDLQRQVDEYRGQANLEMRSQYILSDKQQATDIKFRSVKTDVQCMKKICKQANMAIRYCAQHVKSNAIQSDLRRIAEIIHPDSFNSMGIEHMRSPDMVMDTSQMQELIKLSNNKQDPEL